MSLTTYLSLKDNEKYIRFQDAIKSITPTKREFKVMNSDKLAFDTKEELKVSYYLSLKDNEKYIRFQDAIKSITPTKREFKVMNSDKLAFDTKEELKVSYNLTKTQDAALLGTAFDYLARFRIAQIVKRNNHEVLALLGTAFDYLARFRIAQIVKRNNHEVLSNIIADNFFYEFKSVLSKEVFDKLYSRHCKIKDNIKEAIDTNNGFSDTVINDALTLAVFEQCWRGKTLPKNPDGMLGNHSVEVKEQLKSMIRLFESGFVQKVVLPSSIVKYNPSFGSCSAAIGGADADIYIDGILYDFKTTKSIGYKGKDAQQVMGYYILDLICKKRKYEASLNGLNIDSIAIYLARIGEIYYFDVKDIDKIKLENVLSDIEDILFENINLDELRKIENLLEYSMVENRKYKFKKFFIAAIFILIVSYGVFRLVGNDKLQMENDISSDIDNSILTDSSNLEPFDIRADFESKKLEAQDVVNTDDKLQMENDISSDIDNSILTDSSNLEPFDIRADFESKKLEAQDVVNTELGLYKYNNIVINILRSYDISNIEYAEFVYEESDKLLNYMYKEFKESWSEESFKGLRDSQRIWVDNKIKTEENMQGDELLKYQTLIKMTLDRCEEWTKYYK